MMTAQIPANKPRILIVDDEELFLKSAERNLRRRYHCSLALGGFQALSILKEDHNFDIIMSDMRMPKMSGIELLQHCKVNYPDIVRIMLTGNIEERTKQEASECCEVFSMLNKPCDMPTLIETVERAIASRY